MDLDPPDAAKDDKDGDALHMVARDFFLNMVSYPPSMRYDAVTALQHPWITRNKNDRIPLSH